MQRGESPVGVVGTAVIRVGHANIALGIRNSQGVEVAALEKILKDWRML